jgi:hypothetical protein
MKYFFLLLACLCTRSVLPQNGPPIEWQKSYGGTAHEVPRSIKPTLDGGYIVAGGSDSDDGDVSVNNGGTDLWVVKIDSLGTLEWERAFGGSDWDEAEDVIATSDSCFLVVGHTNSNDGDVTGNNGFRDFWVLKLDAAGELLWQKVLGGSNSEHAHGVVEASDGGYVIAGYTSSSDGDVIGGGGFQCWVVKLSSDGDLIWQQVYGGSGVDHAFAIARTNDDGYVIAGESNSNNGHVSGNNGGYDVSVIKIAGDGTFQWQRSFGGSGADRARSIQRSFDGGYVMAGTTYSTDGDVTNGHGDSDVWVVKIDATGNLQWEHAIGGMGLQYAEWVDITIDGGYVVGGIHPVNGGDHWIIKLNADGEIEWDKTMGSQGLEGTFCVVQTQDEGYIVTGESGHNSGDVTDNNGGQDFWVVKLGPYELSTAIQDPPAPFNEFSVQPNPFTDDLTIEFLLQNGGQVELMIYDALGRSIHHVLNEYRAAGKDLLTIDTQDLPTGIMYLQLSVNGHVTTRKIIKL